ncbi:MAG TPA: serine O-acetyltransferase EpsC [Oscillospiraceae bacterium]|nr:serine O-acetyltransferase EpsC [Oscillospiraceae bacterium]
MFKQIREELQAIRERDPAAKSLFEIWLLYPGYRAVRSYRRAHWFYEHGHYLIARWISQRAARKTGIEIHPGAKIGKGLFIDHGSGVVIGETSEIGNNCTIYQGATLGGTGKDSGKRHPTLGNNVMVGAGARILGPFTVGENSKIASNAVVLEEVPPNSTAVGVPATIVKRNGLKVQDLDQVHMPDPVSQQFCKQLMLIDKLTEKLNEHIKDANTDTIDIQE